MIKEIRIQAEGVEYELSDNAPDDAREQLADANDPTNPTVAREVLNQS